ncbi:hypothetical protein RFI_20978 [Reticulomyxa filosa]|uniref:Uncharacterized protein n=1 Tax=Reticulomyxa filosa TaxID=46433 RepID=X6MRG4_RETFI|nr:hypothetical protein RFI_20978 [Reticulomyxa filosa]|eukprot:ETO16374.1 hypothetical protein RFI_20978 [Reticulomyxa filosa]
MNALASNAVDAGAIAMQPFDRMASTSLIDCDVSDVPNIPSITRPIEYDNERYHPTSTMMDTTSKDNKEEKTEKKFDESATITATATTNDNDANNTMTTTYASGDGNRIVDANETKDLSVYANAKTKKERKDSLSFSSEHSDDNFFSGVVTGPPPPPRKVMSLELKAELGNVLDKMMRDPRCYYMSHHCLSIKAASEEYQTPGMFAEDVRQVYRNILSFDWTGAERFKIPIKAAVALEEFEVNYLYAIREDDDRIEEKRQLLDQLKQQKELPAAPRLANYNSAAVRTENSKSKTEEEEEEEEEGEGDEKEEEEDSEKKTNDEEELMHQYHQMKHLTGLGGAAIGQIARQASIESHSDSFAENEKMAPDLLAKTTEVDLHIDKTNEQNNSNNNNNNNERNGNGQIENIANDKGDITVTKAHSTDHHILINGHSLQLWGVSNEAETRSFRRKNQSKHVRFPTADVAMRALQLQSILRFQMHQLQMQQDNVTLQSPTSYPSPDTLSTNLFNDNGNDNNHNDNNDNANGMKDSNQSKVNPREKKRIIFSPFASRLRGTSHIELLKEDERRRRR